MRSKTDPIQEEANALLEASGYIIRGKGPRSESPDCYTEYQLDRHRRNEFSNYEEGIRLLTSARIEMTAMLETELAELFSIGRLNDTEQIIFGRVVWEMATAEEIAKDEELSTCAVESIIARCRNRIITGLILYPFWGWLQIYWSEVNRHDSKPSSCSTSG